MRRFWDERYDTDHFVYGKEPNRFFTMEIDKLPAGRILLPGEGEGRNAVYAASMGWEVDAFDQSIEGGKKAREYATEKAVNINYQVCDLEQYRFRINHYHVVGLTFFHALPSPRRLLHRQVQQALLPGGRIIFEAFHTSQLGRTTGGPQSPQMLYNQDILLEDFTGMETILIEHVQINLDEGSFHQGDAEIIRYIGKKN